MTSNLFTARARKQQPPKICIAPPLDLPPGGPYFGSALLCAASFKGPRLCPPFDYNERAELFHLDLYLGGNSWESSGPSPSGFFWGYASFNPEYSIVDIQIRAFESSDCPLLMEFTERRVRSAAPLNTGQQYETMFNWKMATLITQ